MKRFKLISVLLVLAVAFGFLNVGGVAAQEEPQYYLIDETGGDCSDIGTWGTFRDVPEGPWPPVSGVPTCTLNQDVNGAVVLFGDVGLDGAGHTITGAPYEGFLEAFGILIGEFDEVGAVVENVVVDLSSWGPGATFGIVADGQPTLVMNSIIKGAGGGVVGSNSFVWAQNNTFVDNFMGGVGSIGDSEVVAVNNIFVGGEAAVICDSELDGAAVFNNAWDQSEEEVYPNCSTAINNISADPSFVDPDAGDYHLQADSPAIDAGVYAGDLVGTMLEDLDGNPRVVDGNCDGTAEIDIGAYEYVPSNCPPVLSVDADPVTVIEGDTASNGGAVSDPDGDPVTLSASAGAVVDDGDGTWSWSYDTTDGPDDSQTVTITADDGNGGATEASFELVVDNVAPSVAADNATVTVDEGQTAANSGTYGDPGDDTVSLSASAGTLVDNLDGTWSWSFDASDGPDESQTVTITATDSDGASSQVTFDLVVNNVAPTIVSVTNDGPIIEGQSATISVDASDPAGANDPLSYEFDCDNDGSYEVGPQAGNSAVCSFPVAGEHPVNVQVTDGDGGVATGSTMVSVQTAAGATDALLGDVQTLADSGVLKPNQANGLLKPLNNAIKSLDKGKLNAACSQLQDFRDEVAQKILDGALTAEQAQPLFDSIDYIMASIGCGA